ncbi:phospholipid carrier-dependent glycosyltransferase [Sporichthya sp.]|uniref:phospholipid carrier-dependent glycosyltransferase n=1 Tax=Sporichthya sp. TaxID=65475 RepID=UPI001823FAE1|nr:phospholipid carrier-dependent glycosyltransferase [Sporichthya sp.]MBA3743255.1 phospholipid carrier-dependent glycosyltransferase [Sporichthya sp.]
MTESASRLATGSAAAHARPARFLERVLRVPTEVYVLAGLAVLTRFVWLTRPRAIVFDEVYFRDAALRYKDSSYYFDPHPPLGKLILAAWAKLVGIDAEHNAPDCTAGAGVVCPPIPPAAMDPAVALRVIPALAGAALIVVFYYFLRELGTGRKVATLGAGLLLLDNALTLESRLILLDSMLLCFGMAAITVFLAARRSTGRRQWVLLVVAAVLTGMCVSIKVTGLCVLGAIALVWLVTTIEGRVPWRRWSGQAAVLLLVPFLVFFTGYTVHNALLHNSGDGDRFMSERFQATLKGNPLYDPNVSIGPIDSFWQMQEATHEYEKALKDRTHPYQSDWKTWPVEKRSIYYYLGPDEGGGKHRYLYLIGNPVVWWGTLGGVALTLLGWLLAPGLFRPHRRRLALLAVTYLGSYLPFMLISRPMFLYHYFFPLMFSLAFAVYGIGILAGWVPTPAPADGSSGPGAGRRPAVGVPAKRRSPRELWKAIWAPRPVTPLPVESEESAWRFQGRGLAITYWAILTVALLTFLWFSPLTYGFALSDRALANRMWLDSWR